MISTCWPALTILLVTLSQTMSSNLLACNLPKNFTVMISEEQRANIYGIELWIGIKTEDISIMAYPDRKSASIIVDNIIAEFKGNMVVEFVRRGVESEPREIFQMYNGRAIGTTNLVKGAVDNYAVQDCRMFLSSDNNVRDIMVPAIDNEIRRLAESCLGPRVCQSIGIVDSVKLSTSNESYYLGQTSSDSRSISSMSPSEKNWKFSPTSSIPRSGMIEEVKLEPLQSTINYMVDIALRNVIEKLRNKSQGIITIPNIDEQFSTGSFIKVKGQFEAINGNFGDLTTLKQTQDVVFFKDGLKMTASCGFELSEARLHYDRYRVKMGILKFNGKLTGQINGAALATRISVDYNRIPCTKHLEYLRVTNLGKVKINVTGMGLLNSLVSRLLTWVTKKWREDVVNKVEVKLTKVATQELIKFNCEKYRP